MRTTNGPVWAVVVVGLVAALVAGCAEATTQTRLEDPLQEQGAQQGGLGGPGDTLPLWERINRDEYSKWSVAPGYQTPQPARGPHGERVQIFLNEDAAQARIDGATSWPQGSIIVKDIHEGYERTGVAALEKTEDGWTFAQWGPNGEPAPDDEAACAECHGRGTDGTLGVSIGR